MLLINNFLGTFVVNDQNAFNYEVVIIVASLQNVDIFNVRYYGIMYIKAIRL